MYIIVIFKFLFEQILLFKHWIRYSKDRNTANPMEEWKTPREGLREEEENLGKWTLECKLELDKAFNGEESQKYR